MIYSLKGVIVERDKESVAIDLGNIAYECLVSHPENYVLGEETTLYTYEAITQDEHYLVGFSSKLEKSAFEALISVKGVGPKTALQALGKATPEELFKAIEAQNTSYLKKLPGIGPKAAAQIVLDLKGKLAPMDQKGSPVTHEEARLALKTLGFKAKEIDDALTPITEPGLTPDEVLKIALQNIRKNSR